MCNFQRRKGTMDVSFITGSEKIISYLGFFPSFHDDYIESIEVGHKKIVMNIEMNQADYAKNNEKIKLVFKEIENYSITGELYGYVSIISDVLISHNEGLITCEFSTSLGTECTICAKEIEIELIVKE